MTADPIAIVFEEWERGGDGGHAIIVAAFTGEDALVRAEAFADARAQELAAEGQNVYCVTGADDYEGDLDPGDWDVDVHAELLQTNQVNPS